MCVSERSEGLSTYPALSFAVQNGRIASIDGGDFQPAGD
jgi:hypothetical protein